jgi:hypothetical protein
MKITQRAGFFGGKFTLHITSHDELVLTNEKILNKSTSKYLLDNINPLYESYKQFSMPAAIMSVVFMVLSIFLFWYGKTYFTPPNDVAYLFMSSIIFIAALVAGVKALRSRLNIVCFNSIDGRRLFSLFGNKPSTEEVEYFCEELKKQIERIRYNGEISSERMADILGRHVEFLYEHEVLSQAEKESALNKITNKTKFKVVSLSSNKVK